MSRPRTSVKDVPRETRGRTTGPPGDTTARRLSKVERRAQLIETAFAVVREEGTDALTLGRVAERAGVTKPIAYEHFETRAGLLVALYEDIDGRQMSALVEALENTRARLADVVRVLAAAYMHCYVTAGPEWHAVAAALRGDAQTEAFQEAVLERYVAFYVDTLSPLVDLTKRELHLRCVAVIGAAEAISRDMLRGRIDEKLAARTLESLLLSWLPAKA